MRRLFLTISAIAASLALGVPNLRAQVETWTVAADFARSVGATDSPLVAFEGVSGVVTAEDGRLIVLDVFPRIVVFDPEWKSVLREFGRSGGGPGEFALRPRWMQRIAADSLLVFEVGNGRRLSYFTPDDGFARMVTPKSVPTPMFWGALSDGTLVASRPYRPAARPPGGRVMVSRGELELLRLDASGRVLNQIAVVPNSDIVLGSEIMDIEIAASDSPFKNTLVLPHDDRIYVATGDTYEVLVFEKEGGPPDRLSRSSDLSIATPDDFVSYLEEHLPASLAPRPWRAMDWSWTHDHSWPAVTGLLVDGDGHIWAEDGGRGTSGQRRWSVFDKDGLHTATVRMPEDFRPYVVRAGLVIGVWRDEYDVQSVQARRLVKRGIGG